MVIFMTINLRGNIQYVLVHRGLILATMVLVAFAAGIATVLFQTVTNRFAGELKLLFFSWDREFSEEDSLACMTFCPNN